MAEVAPEKPLSLAEQYSLQDIKKVDQIGTSVEKALPENEIPANACSGSVAEKTDKTPIAEEDRATEETYNESTQEQESEIQEDEEKPEIKLETAPADFRFPTTNQTRHCFTRYIEYHRCVAAKGEDVPECNKFAKFYRSLCPSEWVERWNEQRGNGTFPGPL